MSLRHIIQGASYFLYLNYSSGLSVDILESGYASSSHGIAEGRELMYVPSGDSGGNTVNKCDIVDETDCTDFRVELDQKGVGSSHSTGTAPVSFYLQSRDALDRESDDAELGDFFLEDSPSDQVLPPEVLEIQKEEIMRELCNEKNLAKLEGIWKKVISSTMKLITVIIVTIGNFR